MVKIYTKTGDKGLSSMGVTRLPKTHIYFVVMGSIDLLNSNIGILACNLDLQKNNEYNKNLQDIQSNLMSISSYLSGYLLINLVESIKLIEEQIDLLENNNLPLKNFILPGGSLLSAIAHNLRALCRKTEIDILHLLANQDFILLANTKYKENYLQCNLYIQSYINRLSDYFFVLARAFNNNGKNDILWRTQC